MAVKITVRPAAGTTQIIDVPTQVRNEVEALYKELAAKPGTEGYLSFESEDERLLWTRQARTYCQTRTSGVLKFRQLPSKDLPVTDMRLQITADLEANGKREGRKN